MTIKDADERSFYETESRQANWYVRELKRQKASCLYEQGRRANKNQSPGF